METTARDSDMQLPRYAQVATSLGDVAYLAQPTFDYFETPLRASVT